MFIVIICFPVCDVKNFKISLNFLTKIHDKNLNILRTKRAKYKTYFIVSKGFQMVKNCLGLEGAPLKFINRFLMSAEVATGIVL